METGYTTSKKREIASSRKPDKAVKKNMRLLRHGNLVAQLSVRLLRHGNLTVSLPRNDWAWGIKGGVGRAKPAPHHPYPRTSSSLRGSSNVHWNDRSNPNYAKEGFKGVTISRSNPKTILFLCIRLYR